MDWISSLSDSIWHWLLSLRRDQHPGQFRFCQKGSVFEPSSTTGLFTSCFALKIGYQINKVGEVEETNLKEWTEYIRSFQTGPEGRFKGLFEDKEILKYADKRAGLLGLLRKEDVATRRAETRQACAALMGAGASPKWPVLAIPDSPKEVERYIDSLPWRRNPWRAGSHTSHLVFFLKLNAEFFDHKETFNETLPVILKKLDSLHDKETGSWFIGRPDPRQIVNAAMKVITLYDLLSKPFSYPEQLIDFCLEIASREDACHTVDIIYVLYQCSRLTNHRRSDILAFAEQSLGVIKKNYKSDGAFSFFTDKANTTYYGVRVSKGYPESDVHGTHLLVWALSMIGELLGFNEELGWRSPVT